MRDDVDRMRFLGRLSRTVDRHRWTCLAYCLLENHFHLLVQTPHPNLGVGMKWLNGAYAQDFNRRYKRTGHLFGDRFHSAMIESNRHLASAVIYVLLNPVRAGIVSQPEGWPWSSCAATVGLTAAPSFLAVTETLELIDVRPAVARRVLTTAMAEMIELDRRAARWGLTPTVRPPGSDPELDPRVWPPAPEQSA